MGTVKRDISAVEASFELAALPLYRSSHNFQSISLSGSRVLERTGSTITKNTPFDRYLSRGEKEDCSWYSFICKSGRVPVISGSSIRATWPLEEEYCRTMLLLHWPNWRRISDIKTDDTTWTEKMEVFMSTDTCPSFVKADIERARRHNHGNDQVPNQDEDDNGEDQGRDEDLEPEWMDLVRPNAMYDDYTSEFLYDDGGPEYDWSAQVYEYPTDRGVKWLQNIHEKSLQSHDDNELNIPDARLNSMNTDQQFAFNLVMKTLYDYKENPDTYNPLRLIVAGTAGSGKSYLIKCLVNAVRTLFQSNKSVQVLCPTGNSAHLISGVTLHSFLKVPTRSKMKEMSPPDGSLGEALQKNCDGLQVLLVDERSLIGCSTLGWMEYLCRCGMQRGTNSMKSWGGLPVVVFLGDDVQLPPVCDSPVYNCQSKTSAAMHGALVWKEFTTAATLHNIIRQGNDQIMLKGTLSAMREYKTTGEQARWLQKFQWDTLKRTHGDNLLQRMSAHGLFAFPTHEDEWKHNKAALLEQNKSFPIAKINAVDMGPHSKQSASDKAGGLVRTLYLCKGAKVMLTSNLNVPYGLFNGAVGTVIDIIYPGGKTPVDSIPEVVMVEFGKYSGPPFLAEHPKLLPIVPVERRVDCFCHGCKRKQIPLRLGWGTTIHRCQGMTIGTGESHRYIIINPGTRQFESRNPGALFVALSRAKSAEGDQDPDFAWHSHTLVNEDRLCHVVDNKTTRSRAMEINRIDKLSRETRHTYAHLDGHIYLNIEE